MPKVISNVESANRSESIELKSKQGLRMSLRRFSAAARCVATGGSNKSVSGVFKRTVSLQMSLILRTFPKRNFNVPKQIESLLAEGLTIERVVDHDNFLLYFFNKPEKSVNVEKPKKKRKKASDDED